MIIMHHIGGKNGTYPFPVKKGKLLNDLHLVLYDADPNCLEHMNVQGAKGEFSQVKILPHLIGERSAEKQFNITFHSTNSSIYEFNTEFADFHAVHYPRYGEYRFGNGFEITKKIIMNSLSLAEALKKNNLGLDILTLDVQGAEFDIINGSKNLIEQHPLCIQLEVEFAEIYKDQKTFSSLHDLLQSLGFILVDLHSLGKASSGSLPIGFRGEERIMWSEAVYLKSFSNIYHETDIEKIVKWTFFAFIYKQMGLCLQGLKLLENKNYFVYPKTYKNCNYEIMLEKIWQIYKEDGIIFLPKFHELFTESMIENFYKTENEKIDCSKDQKTINQNFSKTYSPSCYALAQALMSRETTNLEALCMEYNLDELAHVLKSNRLRDAKFFVGLYETHQESAQ